MILYKVDLDEHDIRYSTTLALQVINEAHLNKAI